MTILQLNPALPVYVEAHDRCPGGMGIAHLVIDYGIEANLYWVVFLDDSRECWTVCNSKIRAQKNISLGRYTKNTSPMLSTPVPIHP